MIDIIHRFRWPIAVVASLALITWVVVAGFGDAIGINPDVQATVARAAAWVETVLLPPLIRLALRDEDGDGKADLFQRGTGLIVLIVALVVPSAACAATPYETALNVHGSTRALHAAAVQEIRDVIADDLRSACESAEDTDACVDARLERWRPTEAGVDAAAEVLDAVSLVLYGWGRRVLEDEDQAEVRPPGLCDLSQRAIDQVLRIVAKTELPVPPDATISLGCPS